MAPKSAVDPVTSTVLRPAAPRQRTEPIRVGSPRLSVVVVNYRQWDKTADLVRQMHANLGFREGDIEAIVVDNQSPSHPVIKKLRRTEGVSLRLHHRNQGFATAVNEGCRLGQGGWLLLLNPDTTLSDEFLDGVIHLTESLQESHEKIGIVGFQLRNSDGTQQLSAGPFPTLFSTLARIVLPRSRRKYLNTPIRERRDVPWVTGCCLLVRRDCLEAIGGLDEDFFLYYEDVDLCLRAQQHGWRVVYEPDLAVIHHQPLHLRTVPAILRLITRHSLLVYATKHWPAWQFRILNELIGWESWLRAWWMWWRGDIQQARHFEDLRIICRDLRNNDPAAARERIHCAVRRIDVRVGV